jgi:hypothetical protein
MRAIASATALLAILAGIGAAVAVARPAGTAQPRAEVPLRRASPPLRTAPGFLRLEILQKSLGRWDEAWDGLYPGQRRVLRRAAYVACEASTPFPAPLQSFRVVGMRRSLVHVAGLSRPVPGVELTTRVAVAWYGPRDPVVFPAVFHLVPDGGRWTWILSSQRFAAYRSGGCSETLRV